MSANKLTWIIAAVAAGGLYLMSVLSRNLAVQDLRNSLTCPAGEQLVHSVITSASYRAPGDASGQFRDAYQAEWRCELAADATGQNPAYRDHRMWVDRRTDEMLSRGRFEEVAVGATADGRPAKLVEPVEVSVGQVLDEWRNPAGQQPDRYFVVALADGRQETLLASGFGGWYRFVGE